MSRVFTNGLRALGRRGLLLLAALALSVPISSTLAAGPISAAHAESFCNWVWLSPYGQGGNSCDASLSEGNWHMMQVSVVTFERAGCVTYIGYYGESYHSWACAPANSRKDLYLPNDGGWYRGSIRNNNMTYGARFGGSYLCCWP